jgi:signal transduction histidine kinase
MGPSPRGWTVLGWALCAAALVLTALALVMTAQDAMSTGGDIGLDAVLGLSSSLLGAFVVTRYPTHPVGWLFLLGGLSRAVAAAAEAWSVRALVTAPGSLPGGDLATWLAWSFLLTVATAPMIVVLFPDGRLPGPRWRVVPVLAGIAAVLLAVVVPIGLWPHRGPELLPDVPAPDTTAAHVVLAVLAVGGGVALVAVVLALGSLVDRFRRSVGDVRQQVKWFALGASCAVVLNTVGLLPGLSWVRVLGPVPLLAGIGLGIFRFRLYGVDRLINRTLVYGLLTVALLASFAAVDVTLALIVDGDSVAVAAGSAFVTALLLRPARDRIQDLIDRVFDRRTYDGVRVLRRLSEQVGHEQVQPVVVRDALRRALRDPGAEVFFHAREPAELVDATGAAVSLPAGRPTTPVGEIAVITHADGDRRSREAVLRAATPVLEHARLQAELAGQLTAVRASRARLALAADEERRRIERDLHDGAQQRLVGLALHVQSARRRALPPSEAAELLAFTVGQLQAGVEDIRSLVHGILPPALASGGLPAALADLARPGEVSVRCAVCGRLDPSIEATAWFVACEGIANARKHAPDVPVHVDVSVADGRLQVRVCDDGPGGADPGGDGLRHLADRVEAHDGTLELDSPLGGGTRLVAELPCG